MKTPLLCVTADDDEADKLAGDLQLFLGGAPTVLRLPADDALPWDELIPDSTVVTERLGALFHLTQGDDVKALVVSVRGLSRRVLPPSVMGAFSETLNVATDHPMTALAKKLTDMGYRNSPLVEDVGTFSLRGDILDVFPPLERNPVRLEFFGDYIEKMRQFDPQTQRTAGDVKSLKLLPARELFFSDATRAAAEKAVRDAAEQSDVPTSRVRERIDQIREGLSTAGLEGLLPGFYAGGLATVFDYLPLWSAEPIVWIDEPVAQDRAMNELEGEVTRSHAEAVHRGELTLPPAKHFLSPDALRVELAKLRTLEGGGLTLDPANTAPISFPIPGNPRPARGDPPAPR